MIGFRQFLIERAETIYPYELYSKNKNVTTFRFSLPEIERSIDVVYTKTPHNEGNFEHRISWKATGGGQLFKNNMIDQNTYSKIVKTMEDIIKRNVKPNIKKNDVFVVESLSQDVSIAKKIGLVLGELIKRTVSGIAVVLIVAGVAIILRDFFGIHTEVNSLKSALKGREGYRF